MNETKITPEAITRAAENIPAGQPVVMLNLLRYRQQAEYAKKQVESISGREVYHQRYVPAFGKLASAIPGIQVLFLGTVQAGIVIGPEEIWDEMALVEYPSLEAFRSVVESAVYHAEADPHRKAALEDWRLIAMLKVTPPQP